MPKHPLPAPAAPALVLPARRVWPLLLLRDALIWTSLLLFMRFLMAQLPPGIQYDREATLQEFTLVTMGAAYGNNLVLVPRLFDKGRYGWYALALLGWALVLELASELLWPGLHPGTFKTATNAVFTMLLSLGLLMVWRTVAQRRNLLRRNLLEREQQLRLLEAQVNPHFLFNTLNSLYALSLTQSPQTPDMLLALAGLMRYQLESTKHAQVPLADELAYLRDYARLQELRLGARCPVTLVLPAEEEVAGLTVPPLLFLALVENAFTYGTRRAVGSFVALELTVQERHLTLTLRNALPPPTDQQGGTGTGLSNTRQRLALLYPHRHRLLAAPNPAAPDQFLTQLTLDL
ncbi:sensor histidine kinase [Hymenobacter aerophilus]|uniref:sensor histidine kinase n=1 Tax=Hymenobacter aerophilus TaxID=119644 RepID=UPI00037EA2F2|nr:histidine kinase [Hymenobacter aerophilus]